MTQELDPWEEPVRGGPADPSALGLTGRAKLEALRDGRLRQPANARLTGRRLTAIGERSVTFTLPASPWLLGPKGTIHPGALVLLGDSALTGAVLTQLPAGVVFTTAELSMTFLGDMPGAGGEMTATASLIHSDERHGLAVADLRGPAGEHLAFGTSRVFLLPPLDPSLFPDPVPPEPEPTWDTPDPWTRELTPDLRPVPTGPHGLEVLRATAGGDRPRPPIDRLFGIRVESVTEGEITFAMPASEWLTNEMGTVSGGAIGLLAKSATSAAGQTVARPGYPYRALDVKINYLKQVAPDGELLRATGRAVYRGKLMVASTEVTHGEELVAVATGSTVLGN